MYLDDCVCVLSDLTWLPLLGVGRKSWYIILVEKWSEMRNICASISSRKKLSDVFFLNGNKQWEKMFSCTAMVKCQSLINFMSTALVFLLEIIILMNKLFAKQYLFNFRFSVSLCVLIIFIRYSLLQRGDAQCCQAVLLLNPEDFRELPLCLCMD